MLKNGKLSYLQKKLILISASIFLSIFVLWFSREFVFQKNIRDYNPKSDKEFILNLFKNNWYWLVSEHSTDFSPEYMLDNKASSKELYNKNNLTIKTYHDAVGPVGFVAYYMKELFIGFILFIAVDENQRSKGYARKLLEHAINDLKDRGAVAIRLITRTSNLKAQKLYKGMGFKEIWTDGDFIKFEKTLE